jgi:tetratricopeptide (TPR) repeat protein
MRKTPKNPDVLLAEAQRLTDQASLLWNEGSFPKTEALCRQALKLTRSAVGDRDPRVAERLYNLATLYHFQRRFDEAKPLFQEAILIHEAQASVDGKSLAFCHAWLAKTLFEAWRDDPDIDAGADGRSFAEAEACYRQAIRLLLSNDGVGTVEYSACLVQLGYLLYYCDRFAEAEPLLCEAISLREALFGPDHLETAEAIGRLAIVYSLDPGLNKEPEPLLRRAYEIRRAELPPNDREVAEWTYRLARYCEDSGQVAEAQNLFVQLTDLLLAEDAPVYHDLDWVIDGCIGYLEGTGQNEFAEEIDAIWNAETAELRAKRYEVSRRETMFGPDHPRVAEALCVLGDHLRFDERYGEALELYERALAIRERADGPSAPTIVPVLNSMAMVHRAEDEIEAARTALKRAAAIPFAPDVAAECVQHARALEQLAWVASAEDAADRSADLFHQAIALVENLQPPDYREAAEMRYRYSIYCAQESRFEEAEANARAALDHAALTTDLDELEIADYREQYASVLTALGREQEATEQLGLVEAIWAKHDS